MESLENSYLVQNFSYSNQFLMPQNLASTLLQYMCNTLFMHLNSLEYVYGLNYVAHLIALIGN